MSEADVDMPDRMTEIQHLAMADDHIRKSETLIHHLEQSIAVGRAHGRDVEQAVRAVRAMRDALEVYAQHRDLIVQAIRDIDAA